MQTKPGKCISCTSETLYYLSSSLCCKCHTTRSTAYHTQNYRFRQRGVTREWYVLEASKGCAICKTPLSADSKIKRERGHIDHDHTSGKTRGVLCDLCNKGLGQFKDNVDSLNNAIKYLEHYA